MSRPLSWYPLAATDPVPGDPVAVRAAGDRYGQVAEAISSAANSLNDIAALDGYDSDAVEVVRDRARTIADEISKAHHRYTAVSQALVTYAPVLSQAQADSAAALSLAQSAQNAIDDASADVRRISQALDDTTDDASDDEVTVRQRDLDRARRAVDSAETTLARARMQLDHAVTDRDRAAGIAIDAIRAGQDDNLGDGMWENWGSKVAHAVSDIAGSIAAVAGIASLFLGWVPILGQALAAVALIMGAVALIADIVLLIAGEGSWTNVILGTLGIVSFGIGRLVGAGAKAAATGARGTARLAAGSAAGTSRTTRIAQGLSARSSARAIVDMAGPEIGSFTRVAARGMASEGNALRTTDGLADLLSTLRPGAVAGDLGRDVKSLFTLHPNGGTWVGAFQDGWSTLTTALRTGPGATLAALSGDAATVNHLASLDAVVPELAQVAPRYREALTTMHAANAAAAGAFGFDKTLNGYSTNQWIDGLLAPSAAETLNLR